MTAMDQHPLGVRAPVTHACPECPLGHPKPFCEVCLGAGSITTERLDRYCMQLALAERAADRAGGG